MNSSLHDRLRQAAACDWRFDDLTRQLYATDASLYQVIPDGVAFPASAQEVAGAIRAAAQENLAIIPRGAGTGLAGGAVGEGIVLDVARRNRAITGFNPAARTVRVGAGVVLDQLNAYLQPHGLTFGPDVATSSRATFGGMIGNNSSGARAPRYGATIDHVDTLEFVTADGRIVEIGVDCAALAGEHARVEALIQAQAHTVRERFHQENVKRWPGYGVDRYLRNGSYLAKLIGGSEGTLGIVTAATLRLVALPKEKGIGLIFFDAVAEAMQATVELLELQPAAIEHIDDVLFDQTRGQLQFREARALLELDDRPCKSILMVEFYEDVDEKLDLLMRKNLGVRKLRCQDSAAMNHVLNLRKAGLSLLTGCKGDSKPAPGIEDVAVPPVHLPDYVQALSNLFGRLGLHGSFYGHAASGLLHVRPVVDMHKAEDIAKFRQVAEEVAALTKQFRGALAAEHGVGIARTEFMEDQLGPELYGLMRDIKAVFDPNGRMNPGKIIGDGTYRFDTHLRAGADSKITALPFEPILAFAAKDESFVGNLEQCNGCGGCRKDPPTMCPTYIATGEEIMSTRGRANTIRAFLENRLGGGSLLAPELDKALRNCLSCRACTVECPSNVNMALLKAEVLHARQQQHGVPAYVRLLSRVDRLGTLASTAPGVANALLAQPFLRRLMETCFGLSAERPFPRYAPQRFDAWFQRHAPAAGAQGEVLLWDDTFVRHNEPHVGQAAVRVLEAAGYTVRLVHGRQCCGRPAFSLGQLEAARRMGAHNVALLAQGTSPVIFLEPSCYSMFAEDYRELGIPQAGEIARRAMLFEDFIDQVLQARPDAWQWAAAPPSVAVHVHCHAKATTGTTAVARIARRVAPEGARILNTGCCGMAGAFGARADTYDLSLKVAEPLLAQIHALPEGTRLVASGASCRHQVEHLAGFTPWHLAEWLAAALEPAHEHTH
jgi:FAD/FMN-containing dehydrogenase/Fe-S oxidoreductase